MATKLLRLTIVGLFCLGLLSCAEDLKGTGSVKVLMNRAAPGLDDLASRIPGLSYEGLLSKQSMESLLSGDDPLFGQSDLVLAEISAPLFEARKAGKILGLAPYWERMPATKDLFPAFRKPADLSDEPWYLPASAYWWGLYYNEEVFRQAGLKPPATWEEFLGVCAALKARGQKPIALSAGFGWTVMAWVNYLDLRLNGAQAYRELLAGRRSFLDPGFGKALELLARLKEESYFDLGHGSEDWAKNLQRVEKGEAAMTLIASYAADRLGSPKALGFTAFPRFENGLGNEDELGSFTVFALAAGSKNPEGALFLADLYVREGSPGLTSDSYRISSLLSRESPTDYKKIGYELLSKAKSLSPFFDRVAPAQLSYDGLRLLSRFILGPEAPNAQKIQETLENLRLERLKAPGKSP